MQHSELSAIAKIMNCQFTSVEFLLFTESQQNKATVFFNSASGLHSKCWIHFQVSHSSHGGISKTRVFGSVNYNPDQTLQLYPGSRAAVHTPPHAFYKWFPNKRAYLYFYIENGLEPVGNNQ